MRSGKSWDCASAGQSAKPERRHRTNSPLTIDLTIGLSRSKILGMRFCAAFLLLFLSACMLEPPAQEMADARSAVKTASELPGHSATADQYLQSAEQALEEAAEAIRQEHYERARSKAIKARRNAQKAARLKQQQAH